MGRLVKIGVWEDGCFIGCVVFAQGNNQYHGRQFGLGLFEVCELVRIALTTHQTAVSRIVSLALGFLRRFCPGIRLVVSYADPFQGHHGGIYQASNWTYVGLGGSTEAFFDSTGKRLHSRSHSTKGAKKQFGRLSFSAPHGQIRRVKLPAKHKYLIGLDVQTQGQVVQLAKPYPKRERSAENGMAVQLQGAV